MYPRLADGSTGLANMKRLDASAYNPGAAELIRNRRSPAVNPLIQWPQVYALHFPRWRLPSRQWLLVNSHKVETRRHYSVASTRHAGIDDPPERELEHQIPYSETPLGRFHAGHYDRQRCGAARIGELAGTV
jgi:hypothetical protein